MSAKCLAWHGEVHSSAQWKSRYSTNARVNHVEKLTDIRLQAPTSCALASTLSHSRLELLALVNAAQIPLQLISGPALEVSTRDEDTAAWIGDVLGGQDENDRLRGRSKSDQELDLSKAGSWQSAVGILVDVRTSEEHDGASKAKGHDRGGNGIYATELLFYAARRHENLGPDHERNAESLSIPDAARYGVYAVPLCSTIINKLAAYDRGVRHSLPSPPPEPGPKQDLNPSSHTILADLESKGPYNGLRCTLISFDELSHHESASLQPHRLEGRKKRKDMSTVFAEASERRRSYKKAGAQSIGGLAAAAIDRPVVPPNNAGSMLQQRRQSRKDGVLNESDFDTHPRLQGAVQSSTRMTNVTAKPVGDQDLQSHNLKNAYFKESDKQSLAKIVMAALRVWGYKPRATNDFAHQKSNSTQSTTKITSQCDQANVKDAEMGSEDEYKVLYHQTFKTSVFTLSRRAARQVNAITQAEMRDVVDRVLDLFLGGNSGFEA